MKKLILLAGLLFLLAGKCSAQTSVQSGPTDPTFCNPGAYFYNTTSQTYRQCGPTANTWAAAGGGLTQVAVLPATCATGALFQLTPGPPYGLDWCPQTNKVADVRGTNATYAVDYGVKGGVQQACLATYSNASTTVTTSASDPIFKATDVGDIFYGSTGSCAGNGGSFTATPVVSGSCPPTCAKIVTYNGPHSVVLDTTPNANCAALCVAEWGPQDDGPALEAAWNAAVGHCPFYLQLPATGMFIGQPIYNTTSLCGQTGGGSYLMPGGAVNGDYGATTLYPLPGLDATAVGANTGILFGMPSGATSILYSNFGINGGDYFNITGATNKYMLISNSGTVSYVGILQWAGTADNLTPILCMGSVQGFSWMDHVSLFNAGPNGVSLYNFCYASFVYDLFYASVANINPSTGNVYTYGSQFSNVTLYGPNNWFDYGSFIYGQISLSGGSTTAFFDGTTATLTGFTTLKMADAGATVHCKNCSITSTTTAVNNGISGAKFYFDDCSSFVSTNAVWTSISVFQTCSPNLTAVTAAKLVLSAGWGTGNSVTVPLGGDAPITFTINNGSAAVGASPTITYTFPTQYPIAPLWCTATQAGGTNPSLAPYVISALTNTGFVATATGTPTINDTEFMQVECKLQ